MLFEDMFCTFIMFSYSCLFNFRYCALVNNAGSTEAGLTQRVHAILDSHKLDYDLEWEHSPSYITPRGNLVEAISAAIGQAYGVTPELSTTGGTSDGRFIAQTCPQVIELGPPNATIHKIDEHVALADIEPLKNIYKQVLLNLNQACTLHRPSKA